MAGSAQPANARGVTIPVYGQSAAPVALVRIADARQGYQRRGFFTIGMLPEYVLEDVRLEFRTNAVISALRDVRRVLGMKASGRAVRISNIHMDVPAGERSLTITARSLLPNADGWHFSDGEVMGLGEATRFAEAHLSCVGADAGMLRLGGTNFGSILINPQNP